MLTKTQALKNKLQTHGNGGESFSQVMMGVGQEFISIVKDSRIVKHQQSNHREKRVSPVDYRAARQK